MSITVEDLLELPHLRLHLYCGSEGKDRAVSWTHVSDLPDPWRWLTGGDLLLTNGMSFPSEPGQQAALIEKLDDAGASGLAIGEKMYCPPLTDEFVAASERLRFSVLMVDYPMPFVAISQAVAAANLLEQSDRLVRTERIYRTVQRMVASDDGASVLCGPLAQVLGCDVHVCHRESGDPWYPQDQRLDPVLAAALDKIASGTADLRAGALVLPLDDGREMRLVDIPTQRAAVLVLVSQRRSVIDAILMQHAVTVVALELSQSLVAIEHRRRLGAELLAQLMEGRIDPRVGRRQLTSFGMDVAEARLLAISSTEVGKLRDSHIALWRNAVPHAAAHHSGVLYLIAVDVGDVSEVMRAELGPQALIGASGVIRSVERMPEALREANWALRAADGMPGRTFSYGDATPFIGVGSIDDAAALVTRALGPLIEYERVHDTPLLATLDAYLANQRSWQKTADVLRVHRQTVLYRIRKVEEITGLSINESRHIAELWLAMQARALLLPGDGAAAGPGSD
ncbi:PucR family transcriptional regulator [Streptomyces sp. NBC_01320]|uniref:PucR family transcriptional regulator n=1 Tax=Streptomyces sp. NBC_01320 TaxID=2903824 RepID=UPI002E15D416|nr:PucR family transcriptional regulator [Streptomyces sp. NBC_01320]